MSGAVAVMRESFSRMRCKAQTECGDLERFPGYFRLKEAEVLLVLEKAGIEGGMLLEIGCGTGYQSSLLAQRFDKIVATDLPDFSTLTHTIGIGSARDMSLRLGARNIKHAGCSAERLPFREGSFDCVFASSVLEHIMDKDAALTEIRRVLKPGGTLLCTIPTYMESIFQFPSLYLYLCKRAFDVARDKLAGKKASHGSIFFDKKSNDTGRSGGDLVRAFLRNNPSFPLPEPHGDWRNKSGRQSIFVEFWNQLPWSWPAMFGKNGFTVRRSFAVLFVPYRVIEIFSPALISNLYCGTQGFRRLLAGSPLKNLAVSICYSLKKEP